MNKNKNDTDKVSQVVEVLGGIFAIIGLIATITTLSDLLSNDKKKTIEIKENAIIEVCDTEFKLKEYIQEDYDLWPYSISEDIKTTCGDFFEDIYREDIELEVREEIEEELKNKK